MNYSDKIYPPNYGKYLFSDEDNRRRFEKALEALRIFGRLYG